MNKSAHNKPAVLKISRKSATRIGSLQVQGPFPRTKKALSSTQACTSQGILGTRGILRKDASKFESSNRSSITPVPVQIHAPSKDQASAIPKPLQVPGHKTSVPASLDRPSTNCDRFRTQEALPKARVPLSSAGVSTILRALQTRVPVPKTKIPVPSGYGKPGSLQAQGYIPQSYIPAFSDKASTSPRTVQTPRYPKSVPIPSERPSTTPGPLQARGPVPKTKIPIRSSTSTSPGPVQPPVIKPTKPITTGRAFGSTYSLQTPGEKSSEPLSSVSKNGQSASRYPGLVQAQGAFLATRTPTSPCRQSVSSAVRNRGSLSASPSYIRIPKTKEIVHPDPPSAGPNRLQTLGSKATKPVSSVTKSALSSDTLQTKGLLPKSNKITSTVSKFSGSPSSSVGSASIGLEPPEHLSWKRAPASSVPAKTPEPKPMESVASANKNQDLASRRRHSTATADSKQSLKKSPSSSPDRNSQLTPRALQTHLSSELNRRNHSIAELEIKLVQNQNLISEQALRLAESKAVQRAKDVALEQLKSELLAAKDEYDRMHLRLEEADRGLEQATCKVNKYLERSTSMEDELKGARDRIVNLQRQLKDADIKAEINCQTKDQLRQDVERMQEQLALDSKRIQILQQSENDLRGDLENRDRLITQINHELATRDEEFRNLFETLKNKHTQLRSQELSMKRLEERYERGSINRSKLEERNAALLKKIEGLKNDLRYYSQMIIANDGKPFFEQVPPGINPDIADGLVARPEEGSQHKRKAKRREK